MVGLHFFNPVPVMKLARDRARADATGDSTVEAARAFAASLGKTPIVVRDTPGFATSRLGVVLGLEAMRMLEQGVASAEDIDRAMELGYNHPMGPLRLTDLVGLDVRLAIAEHLHATLGDDTYRAPALLRRLVGEGKLGKKSGQGLLLLGEGSMTEPEVVLLEQRGRVALVTMNRPEKRNALDGQMRCAFLGVMDRVVATRRPARS